MVRANGNWAGDIPVPVRKSNDLLARRSVSRVRVGTAVRYNVCVRVGVRLSRVEKKAGGNLRYVQQYRGRAWKCFPIGTFNGSWTVHRNQPLRTGMDTRVAHAQNSYDKTQTARYYVRGALSHGNLPTLQLEGRELYFVLLA